MIAAKLCARGRLLWIELLVTLEACELPFDFAYYQRFDVGWNVGVF
jgi:hypothetical protein